MKRALSPLKCSKDHTNAFHSNICDTYVLTAFVMTQVKTLGFSEGKQQFALLCNALFIIIYIKYVLIDFIVYYLYLYPTASVDRIRGGFGLSSNGYCGPKDRLKDCRENLWLIT